MDLADSQSDRGTEHDREGEETRNQRHHDSHSVSDTEVSAEDCGLSEFRLRLVAELRRVCRNSSLSAEVSA